MKSICVGLAFALVGSSWAAEASSSCKAQDSTCVDEDQASVQGNSMLQANVRVGVEEDIMRSDDPDDLDGLEPESLLEVKMTMWPSIASDTLCAMDDVQSMNQKVRYSMFSKFEQGATFTSKDIKRCQQSGCVPALPLTRGALTLDKCQEIAQKRSHPYYGFREGDDGDEDNACYTFADCETGGRVTSDDAAGFELYSRPAPFTYSQTQASPITCEGEAVIKAMIENELLTSPLPADEAKGDDPRRWGPRATILRAVFHDAHDFNSLKAVNKDTNEWEAVTSEGGYAGVDGCMYDNPNAEARAGNELDKMISTDNLGSAFYNFNLQRWAQNQDPVRIDKLAFNFVQTACENLCCSSSSQLTEGEQATLCGLESCDQGYYMDKCFVDVMTFGSLLIIEEAGGPHVPMTWGRKQGDCRNPFKNVAVPSDIDTRRIAQGGASLSSFNKSADVFLEFAGIGMNKSEATALMGAHSFGKLHKYTGGPNTRNRGGGVCNDPTKSEGFFKDGSAIPHLSVKEEHLDALSESPGTCEAHSETAEGAISCWTTERGYLEPARSKSVVNDKDWNIFTRKSPGNDQRAKVMAPPSWGKGGFWDTTPNKLDNQYFVELASTDATEKNNCCGPHTQYGCGTDNTEGAMQDNEGNVIDGCDVNWCMRSAGKTTGWLGGGNPTSETLFPDYALMSTKQYVQSDTPTIDGHVGVHRLYRLAADWALIDDNEAKQVVTEFANDEAAFHKAFAAAWSKVIELGYSAGELTTCAA